MFGGRKKKQPTYAMPGWGRWLFGVFFLYLMFIGYRKETAETIDPNNPKGLDAYPAIEKFVSIDRWNRALNPGFNRDLDYEDTTVGQGDTAFCAHTVTLKVLALKEKEYAFDAAYASEKSLTFTVGQKAVTEALDVGVVGMAAGGERLLHAGARLVDQQNNDVDALPYLYQMRLVSLSPLKPLEQEPFATFIQRPGLGIPVGCGQLAAVMLRLRNADGKIVYETDNNGILLRVGYKEYGFGIDRAVLGMLEAEVRVAHIPPAFLPQKSTIPFPKGQKAIVEIMRIPYNGLHDDRTEKTVKEGPENKQ